MVQLNENFKRIFLRVLGAVEALSLLAILFIAMPIRAMKGDASYVTFFGRAHGILFLMYCFSLMSLSAEVARGRGKFLAVGLLCSCIPFGPFWFDRKYLRSTDLTRNK